MPVNFICLVLLSIYSLANCYCSDKTNNTASDNSTTDFDEQNVNNKKVKTIENIKTSNIDDETNTNANQVATDNTEQESVNVSDVTVYTETNYQGTSKTLKPRGYLISDIGKFKSIKIPSDYEILLSDREDYESNNNLSYSQDVDTIDTTKYRYIYVAKLDTSSVSGIAIHDEYNKDTHEYVGSGITSLKLLDPSVEKITIDNCPQFTGLGNITQYKNLQFIRYNATSGTSEDVFQKDINSIFEFLDKTAWLKDIELVGEHREFSIARNGKFLGVNIKSLSSIPNDATEIYLIDCNEIKDINALSKNTSLRKLFMYGTTLASATSTEWKTVLSIVDNLGISGSLTHVQLPVTYTGEIPKSQRPNVRKIEYYGALGATKIAFESFEYSQKLKEVYFPNVKTIDTWGFHRCTNLTKVDMPQCETISQKAFYCDENLQEVHFKNVKKIGDKSFYQCKRLALVDVPNVVEIGISAFEADAALKRFGDLDKIEKDNIFFVPKLTKIGDYAFKMTDASGQTKIEEAEMPECLSIGKESFSRWRSLKKLILQNCKTIGAEAFYDPYNLRELSLPVVEIIETRAFVYNKGESLNGTLDLPKVKSIGSCAFGGSNYAHPNISVVNAPECTSLANDAFRGNTNLKTITSNTANKILVMQQAKLRL